MLQRPAPSCSFQSSPLQGCSASHQGKPAAGTLACKTEMSFSHSLCDALSPFLRSSTKELWHYLELSVSSIFKFGVFFLFRNPVFLWGTLNPTALSSDRNTFCWEMCWLEYLGIPYLFQTALSKQFNLKIPPPPPKIQIRPKKAYYLTDSLASGLSCPVRCYEAIWK